MIAAKKGEKKMAALHRPIVKIQEMLRQQWMENDDSDKSAFPPQLIIDHFLASKRCIRSCSGILASFLMSYVAGLETRSIDLSLQKETPHQEQLLKPMKCLKRFSRNASG